MSRHPDRAVRLNQREKDLLNLLERVTTEQREICNLVHLYVREGEGSKPEAGERAVAAVAQAERLFQSGQRELDSAIRIIEEVRNG